jgi:NADPH-dependent 2,4-dienoyl-CoA reductase/sulfur reductase-like enzyme
MRLIVVGGVAAGAKAAARARRVNPSIDITLFQEESEVSYTACGQPYYLSGLIRNRESLIIRRASDFQADGIDVRTRHRVTALNTAAQSVEVCDLENDRIRIVPFDRLILATGARVVIPAIPGASLEGVVSLRSMADLDRFRSALDRLKPKNAVIAGGGYLGLELAESLHESGLAVNIVELSGRLLPKLDPEMSQRIHEHLLNKGVRIVAGDGLAEITERSGRVSTVVTTSGWRRPAGLVVLAIGIRPNVELATRGGIAPGPTGAIAVDARMETNVAGIFAAGDCAESRHRLTQKPVWNPLGDIANLHGRVAGENAAGGDARFPGVFGTAIFKSFDLNVGMTGLTEFAAREAGFNPVTARDKARYFPGARELTVKLVAEAGNGRLLGAQAIGSGSVDKMIDIAATALLGNLGCRDLEYADLAYAPPFSPVLSPIIVAASALSKKLGQPELFEGTENHV